LNSNISFPLFPGKKMREVNKFLKGIENEKV
jgi:hypothetical protein